jgi:hypothetical protein
MKDTPLPKFIWLMMGLKTQKLTMKIIRGRETFSRRVTKVRTQTRRRKEHVSIVASQVTSRKIAAISRTNKEPTITIMWQ